MTQETTLISALVQRRRTRRACGWIVMLMLFAMILWASQLHAEGIEKVGDCNISWAPDEPPLADGFRVYWGSTPGARSNSFDAGRSTFTTCQTAGFTDGQHYVAVRSYIASTESVDSNEVPFVFFSTVKPPVLTIQ